ncbi:MAG: tetratricopeptide repeat protein, partial [Kiloniellales bacterium]|nr:tetratricopeptide repeat protein [Kiloniellales bacterium]
MPSSAQSERSKEDLLQAVVQSLMQGRPRQAEALCDEILTHDSDDTQALMYLGSAAYQRGQDIIAEGYLEQALAVSSDRLQKYPNDAAALMTRANILLAQGREEEAIVHLRKLDLPLIPQSGPHERFFQRFQSGIERGLPTSLVAGSPYSGAEGLANYLAMGLNIAIGPLTAGFFPHAQILPIRMMAAAQG